MPAPSSCSLGILSMSTEMMCVPANAACICGSVLRVLSIALHGPHHDACMYACGFLPAFTASCACSASVASSGFAGSASNQPVAAPADADVFEGSSVFEQPTTNRVTS